MPCAAPRPRILCQVQGSGLLCPLGTHVGSSEVESSLLTWATNRSEDDRLLRHTPGLITMVVVSHEAVLGCTGVLLPEPSSSTCMLTSWKPTSPAGRSSKSTHGVHAVLYAALSLRLPVQQVLRLEAPIKGMPGCRRCHSTAFVFTMTCSRYRAHRVIPVLQQGHTGLVRTKDCELRREWVQCSGAHCGTRYGWCRPAVQAVHLSRVKRTSRA